jgi:hypothetical protein
VRQFRKLSHYPKPTQRTANQARWPGHATRQDTPWGRCITAFDLIINHANAEPSAHILLAASTSISFTNMHMACEYYLPQAGAVRKGGVWCFPNGSKLRVSRVTNEADADKLAHHDFSLISVQAEGEIVTLLQPMLTLQGRIIPFLGYY